VPTDEKPTRRATAAARAILFLFVAVVGAVVIAFKLSDIRLPTGPAVAILAAFLIVLVVLLGVLERRRVEQQRRKEEHERYEKPFE